MLRPGRNCWQLAAAGRAAVLVDAAAYFAAVAAAIARAERSVIILSWDVDSRTSLVGGLPEDATCRLGGLLNAALERRPTLRIHVLNWDFAMLYAFEREALPLYRREWRAHRRLHFRFDANHPIGACHHQKVVVVDDAVAFLGGLDICARRWDTPRHDAHDPRRVDFAGKPYAPFHDVQIAVDGPAAAALGTLARRRWERATGERLAPVVGAGDRWPASLRPDFTDVGVGIARTVPTGLDESEVREVETLFLDAIAAARRTIYVENQYFTATRIADALAARLAEPDGPEIVIVVPRECSGWLEQQTMGMRRRRVVERLHAADRHGRLRVYAPVLTDVDVGTNVHSKVMVVDDRLLRVGSANLSNRSMAVDTECDVALEARDDATVARGILGIRDRLLADHLGVAPDDVAAATVATGSLVAAIERLQAGTHTLAPLARPCAGWLDALPPEVHLFDPTEPIDPERLIQQLVPEEIQHSFHCSLLRGAAVLLVLGTVTAVSTALGVDAVALTEPARRFADQPELVVLGFVVGGLAFVPVTVMIIASGLVLGPHDGLAVAVVGVLASAVVAYAIGRGLGRERVRRLAGPRLNRLSVRLARRSVVAVATARVLALAPFTTMNLVAGATRLPFRDYLVGTLIGTVPGVVAIALGTGGLVTLLRRFAIGGIAVSAAAGLGLLALGLRLGRAARTPHPVASIAGAPGHA